MVSVDDNAVEEQPVAAQPVADLRVHVIRDDVISNDVVEAVTHYLRQQGYQELPSFRDFCWDIIRDHIREQRGEVDGMGYAYDDPDLIMSSSNYAIACETLGLIRDIDMVYYAAGRGGSMIYLDEHNWRNGIYPRNLHECKFVNFRDVIYVLSMIID